MTFRMLLVLPAFCIAMVAAHETEIQKWSEGIEKVQHRRLQTNGSSNESNASNATGSEPEPEPETKQMNASKMNASNATVSEPEPEPETEHSNSSSDSSSSSSNASSSSDSAETTAEVVAATMDMKMSQAHATSVADAFAASATQDKVATAMKNSLAAGMAGVTAAHIEIVSITVSTGRLLAVASNTFLRRLNSSNESNVTDGNSTSGASTDVTLVVDFEVTAPSGTTGTAVLALASGMDMTALKTTVETNLKNEADLTVSVTSIATPTASIKTADSSDSSGSGSSDVSADVAGGALPAAVPLVPSFLLVAMLFVGV